MTKKRLSFKQEKWALEYAITNNACEAVRQAYCYKKGQVIRAMAGKLVENGRVMLKVEEFRKLLYDDPEKQLAQVKAKMQQALEEAKSVNEIVKICQLYLETFGIIGSKNIQATQLNLGQEISEQDRAILDKYMPLERLEK